MKIDIQLLNPKVGVFLPRQATMLSAGMDIHAAIDAPIEVRPGQSVLIPTGFAMAIPEGYAAMLLPRSGLGHKSGMVLGNLVGLIDGDYRGEVKVSAWNRLVPSMCSVEDGGQYDMNVYTIKPWERIAQMVIVPCMIVDFNVVDSLTSTDRGIGGFGSTGG